MISPPASPAPRALTQSSFDSAPPPRTAPAPARTTALTFEDGFDDDPDAAGSPPADDWDSDAPPLEDDGTDPEDPGGGSGPCTGTDSPPGPGNEGTGSCHPPLKKGDSGPDVERLQRRLKDLGYLCDEPDGAFGPKTEEAIKNLQRDYGLKPDGQIGDRTWSRIDRAKPDDNGRLSRRYEGTGPGTISGGAGDPGGASYGEYQFSSKQGTAGAFVKWLEARHPDWAGELSGSKPGTREFNAAWSKIAREHPDEFADAQYAYAKQAFYKPAAQNVKNATGLDVGSRSHALQEVLFSTAIQHGTGGARSIFKAALAGKDPSKMSDEEIIRAIYAERGRTDASGVPVHFHNASPAVQRGVLNRFRNEVNDALAMLQREQECPPSKTVTNPPT